MRSIRFSFGVMVTSLGVCAAAEAAPGTLVCIGGADSASEFTLDFPVFGADTAQINQTEYDLVLDGVTGEARIVYYFQNVDSLTLPGGIETGDMVIAVLPGSSTGTYDSVSGTFATEEIYAIYFSGDLSAFGLTSPVYLPGTSSGTLTESGDGVTGAVAMLWDGAGALPDPTNPGSFIPFTYECRVNTEFSREPGCAQPTCELGDVDNDCDVDIDDISAVLSNFGSTFPGVNQREGDVNFDGDVSLVDLSLAISVFGANCN